MLRKGGSLFPLFAFLQLILAALAAPPLISLDEEHPHHHGWRVEIGPRFRLPRDLEPISYDLTIQPILDEEEGYTRFTAPGTVRIQMRVANGNQGGVQNITLNSATIKYDNPEANIRVTTDDGTAFGVKGFYEDVEKQLIYIELEQPVDNSRGVIAVEIPFVAPLPPGGETAFGIYRTSYTTNDNQTRYLAITDFESVDARRMTPCFDEPDLKAPWTIHVRRKGDYHSLSNMPLQSTQNLGNGWYQDNYEISPIMSSYLVAVGVSDYFSSTADDSILPGQPVKVWGPPPMMEQGAGEYAPDFSAAALAFFAREFDEPYTLPKMDKMAIPEFSAGAMENWGLNTYRIVRLMWFPGNSTLQEKVSMSDTIAHELAHQWFGDLVTMRWWGDIWLNEGFATYWSSIAVNSIHPEYNLHEYFVYDSVQTAFSVDVGNSHALHYDGLESPAETRYGFDTISYDKGASILRMTEVALTYDLFLQGLRNYLNTHSFDNAEQDDLFNSLNAVPGVAQRITPLSSVKEFLDTWTLQAGFPLIKVTRSAEDATKIIVSQEHYKNDTSGRKWHIPVSWQAKGQQQRYYFFLLNNQSSAQIAGLDVPTTDYVIINPEQRGYYRVWYDDSIFTHIQEQLVSDPEALNEQTRSALLDDNFNLAYDGYQPLERSLELTKYLRNETKLVPWASFARNMNKPYTLLRSTGAFYCFRKYIRNIVGPNLVRIGFEYNANQEIGNGALLRNRLFEWACNVEHPLCVQQSQAWVKQWMDSGEKPATLINQPDLRPFTYCTAMATAENKEEVFSFLHGEYLRTGRETDQLSLIRALACSKDPYILKRIIQLATDKNSTAVRDSQRVTALQYVAQNAVGAQIIFDSLRDGVDGIINDWGAGVIGSVVSTLGSTFSTTVKYQDLERFINENREKLCPDSNSPCLQASLNSVTNNIKWLETHYETLSSFFNNNC